MFRNHIRLFLRFYFIVGVIYLKYYLKYEKHETIHCAIQRNRNNYWGSYVLSSSLNSITHFNYFEITWTWETLLIVICYTMENIEQNYLNRLLKWQTNEWLSFHLFLSKHQKKLCSRSTLFSCFGYKIKNDKNPFFRGISQLAMEDKDKNGSW